MQKIETKTGLAIVISVTLVLLGAIFFYLNRVDDWSGQDFSRNNRAAGKLGLGKIGLKLKNFSSEEEFKKYLEEGQEMSLLGGMGGIMGGGAVMPMSSGFEERSIASDVLMDSNSAPSSMKLGMESGSQASGGAVSPLPERFSSTNTQVLTIDEADIVKTDGQNIFYSTEGSFPYFKDSPMPMRTFREDGISLPPFPDREMEQAKTKIIKAFPLAEAKKIGEIEKNGDLFLSDNLLIILATANQKIYAYDVSDPKNPKEVWSWDLDENSQIVESRMFNGKLFLVTRSFTSFDSPCPIRPLTRSGVAVEMSCADIYHPEEVVPVDSTYAFISLDVSTGEAENKTAFVGSASQSIVYMSENAIYLTYEKPADYVKTFSGFLEENEDLFPSVVAQKMKNLKGYDIGPKAKIEEMSTLIENHLRGLGKDDVMKLRNEVNNRMDKYAASKGREWESTGIVKVGVNDLKVQNSSQVPGKPINQFALDEYRGNLRIATTFVPMSWFPGGFYSRNSSAEASDVYVLDENLAVIGAVKDLGKGEKIYSVRFLRDRGYVVTFKQIDPFFVLDLSVANKPELKGELKIPGFSSYLHPLPNNQILGIGQEDGKVKITIFGVADPSNPKELSTYRLEDYWTEVSNNHHAFLLDEKHNVFFLPGGQGGYVFSYASDQLSLKKAISDFGVKRAVYINDYLYVIGEEKIKVLNEKTWDDEKEIEL